MKTCLSILAIAAALLFPAGAVAQNFSINWYKVAGGGGISTGGVYTVNGTVGQADAGPVLSDGYYTVTGGFWSLIAVQTTGAPVLSLTHVGSEVIDFDRAFADAMAIVLVADVEAKVFDARNVQIPFVERLLVNGPDAGEPFVLEVEGEVAGDKAARAGDDDQVILLQGWIFFNKSFCFHMNLRLKIHWTRVRGNDDSLHVHDDY